MTQLPLHSIAGDGVAHLLRDHESDSSLFVVDRTCVHHNTRTRRAHPTADRGIELARRPHPGGHRKHSSGGKLGPALTATGRNGGSSCPGAHTRAEAMGTGTPTIARLVRALAQGKSPSFVFVHASGEARSRAVTSRRARASRARTRSVQDNGLSILRQVVNDQQQTPKTGLHPDVYSTRRTTSNSLSPRLLPAAEMTSVYRLKQLFHSLSSWPHPPKPTNQRGGIR